MGDDVPEDRVERVPRLFLAYLHSQKIVRERGISPRKWFDCDSSMFEAMLSKEFDLGLQLPLFFKVHLLIRFSIESSSEIYSAVIRDPLQALAELFLMFLQVAEDAGFVPSRK
jgi:hypothetical protein